MVDDRVPIFTYSVENTSSINTLQNIPSDAIRANVIITDGEVEFSAIDTIQPDGVSDAIAGQTICLEYNEINNFSIVGEGGSTPYSFTVEYFKD